jgi:hypothetical protein
MNPMYPLPPRVIISSLSAGLMKLRFLAGIALLAVLLSFPTGSALAQGTPDGETPATETVCDGLAEGEFGICNAYCEATDCGDGVNYANIRACESLAKNWVKKTGVPDLPCDCDDGSVFLPGVGCGCGHDLTITITDFRPLGCPEGQGSCTYEMDIQVANQGSLDIVDPFAAMVELPGVGLGNSEAFTGLAAGAVEDRLSIPLGPGNNCFDPDCEITAEVDVANEIQECDELNNVDALMPQG